MSDAAALSSSFPAGLDHTADQRDKHIYFVDLSDNGSKMKLCYHLLVLALRFITIIPHLLVFAFHSNKKLILSDTATVKNLILSLVFARQYRNLFYHRIGNIKYFFKWILPEDRTLDIPGSMKIGKTALFIHNTSSFLNAESIGDYFVCYHHVTLGTNRLGGQQKPVIGNNVMVCTGAVVVGGITVGDNVIIGANAVVVKDVPPNCTVIGSPARIVKQNGVRVDILL